MLGLYAGGRSQVIFLENVHGSFTGGIVCIAELA